MIKKYIYNKVHNNTVITGKKCWCSFRL